MKLQIKYTVIICFVITGCIESNNIDSILSEYKVIKSEYPDVEINSIKILKDRQLTYEQLGDIEIERMSKKNNNLKQIIDFQFQLDSLLRKNIEQRNCFHKNAVLEYQKKYEAENKKDSTRLKKETLRRINYELQYYENNLNISNIQLLATSDSILNIKSKWVKHEINFSFDGKTIKDTSVYIQFGLNKLSYLTDNTFRKYEYQD